LTVRERRAWLLENPTANKGLLYWCPDGKTCVPRPCQALTAGVPPAGAARLGRGSPPNNLLCARRGRFCVKHPADFARKVLPEHFKSPEIGQFFVKLHLYVRTQLPESTLNVLASTRI